MAALIWCACLLLCVALSAQSRPDVDRLANLQSDLVRQTFTVIEEAIAAQQSMFDERINGLEARVAELERIIAEGVPVQQPEPEPEPRPVDPPVQPPVRPPVQPNPEPQPEPEPNPEPEPEPATTTVAPTTVKAKTEPPPPPAATTPETCQDLYERGEMANGMYTIDPRGLGRPFEVMCSFDDGVGQTMVHHDSETEVKNKNNKLAGSFQVVPAYNNADTEQLAALTEASSSCQQFVKLRCKTSALFTRKGVDYGWWLSRNGETMKSWGGVPASNDSRACACSASADSGCIGGGSCNCDAGARFETFDEGLLTDKAYLPVKGVYLGDTGGKKQTSHLTITELVCMGRV